MNKSVLVITPFFAPQSHAAVFRAYKLVKYLPAFGWKPYVLTTDINYLYYEDPALLAALPPEVEVVRARFIEPTLRGLRMALGGPDRTQKMFPRLEEEVTESEAAKPRQRGAVPRIYQYLLDHWLHVPDRHSTWYRPALAKAKELIRREKIGLVYTTSPPYTTLRLGRALQKLGCRWVADLRDPLGAQARNCSHVASVHWMQRQIVMDAITHADFMTAGSSVMDAVFVDCFGRLRSDPIRFVATGLDEGLVGAAIAAPQRSHPYFIFTGEFLPEYGPFFFAAFARALQNPDFRRSGIKILLVGNLAINRPRAEPMLRETGILDHVELVDHMPQEKLYPLIQGALAAVVMPGASTLWNTLFAKLVDYLALRKPVLARVPPVSESRLQLTRTRLGIFLDGTVEEGAQTLIDLVTGRLPLPVADEKECERFTARRQVADFVEMFEHLRTGGHVKGGAWNAPSASGCGMRII
jgi:glycosyltransferase involved in cell wall biosynthesis